MFGIMRKKCTAVNVPFDLMKTDSEAASLTWRPSNLSLDASPKEGLRMNNIDRYQACI